MIMINLFLSATPATEKASVSTVWKVLQFLSQFM